MALKRWRSGAAGWAVLYLAILLINLAGYPLGISAGTYSAAALWLGLVLLPSLLGRMYYRRLLQQRYSGAYRLAQLIRFLHPGDGWRQQPAIIRALDLAHQGDLTPALEVLKRFQGVTSHAGLAAVANLYRVASQWEELLAWQRQHARHLEAHPQLLPVMLRARGETGDVRGLIELYDQRREQIGKLVPGSSRDSCRLMLAAFCGKRELTERLLAGTLAVLPEPIRNFWLATADGAAGDLGAAKRQLEQLLPAADLPLRLAIERRVSRLSVLPTKLEAPMEQVIQSATREHGHDETFGGQRSLFSRHARATQMLIALNLLAFGGELLWGGATNGQVLYRLGGLFPPAVRAGDWWRLFAALFLHFGAIHLSMNMLALWWLGPLTEFALGFRRFLVVYLVSGVGSMGAVMALASGPNGDQLTVGASGSIMGLVGATGALMLRGWVRERAAVAKRRLVAVLMIVVMQSAFDLVVPQVSMTAHLSGTLLGFVVTLMLSARLNSATPQRAVAGPA